MKGLSDLFEDVFADLDAPKIPTLPAREDCRGILQDTDYASTSRVSRTSRDKNELNDSGSNPKPEKHEFSAEGSRVTSSYVEATGSAGREGREAKKLAGSTSSFFPLENVETGSTGRDPASFDHPIIDLNQAAPRRAEWLTDATVAALAPQLVQADPLPILPSDVRAGVERELRALAEDGCTGPDALRDAIVITRSKIRNSPVLGERQSHDGRCHVCGSVLDDARPVVAVMQAKGGRRLWLHSECHAEHSRRTAALVDSIMAAAGYGADRREGEAA